MRVLYLGESDSGGGAMKAAFRLMTTVRSLGHEVRMMARDPQGDDPDLRGPRSAAGRLWMKVRRRLDQQPLRRYPQREPALFSTAWLPDGLRGTIRRWRPDVVHVHWINNGFLGLGTLAGLGLPQVWSLHDSWAFTGGCHYHVSCERFRERCGACPALGSTLDDDLSRQVWRRKQRHYARISPQLIAPSTWMAGRAGGSGLLRDRSCAVVRNPIDRSVFLPGDRLAARATLGLPADRQLVLFAALHHGNHNKGLHLLAPALRIAAAADPGIALVAVGTPPAGGFPDVGMPVHHLPPTGDDQRMALINRAVDAVAVPSLSESFSLSVLEAQACGAVPVAFAIGGITDLIVSRTTGWLAAPYRIDELAAGLLWACSAAAPTSATLVASAALCDSTAIAEQHLALYAATAARWTP